MAAEHTDRLFTSVEEIFDLCEQADVLHFNNWIWTHRPGYAFGFEPENEYSNGHPFQRFFKQGKKIVFHFHGGPLQLDPRYWVDESNRVGATMIKCDPYTDIPGAHWMPNILNCEELPYKPGLQNRIAARGMPGVSIMGSLHDHRRVNGLIKNAFEYLRQRDCFD